MNEKALEYLERDRLHHIDMLETLRRGIGELVYAGDDGVVLLNSGFTYMISVESEETLEKVCAIIGKKPEVICAHQARFVPLLQEKYLFRNKMECFQSAYLKKEKLDEKIPEGINLRDLTSADADFVVKHYDHMSDEKYVSERVEAGMLGAFCGGEMAGFIGTHTEGAIGLLQVLPDYRRRGVAYTLEAAMINYLLNKGWVPHGHVVTTNKASIQLQEKLGMSITEKTLTWMFDE